MKSEGSTTAQGYKTVDILGILSTIVVLSICGIKVNSILHKIQKDFLYIFHNGFSTAPAVFFLCPGLLNYFFQVQDRNDCCII